jgi:hypothetical protein
LDIRRVQHPERACGIKPACLSRLALPPDQRGLIGALATPSSIRKAHACDRPVRRAGPGGAKVVCSRGNDRGATGSRPVGMVVSGHRAGGARRRHGLLPAVRARPGVAQSQPASSAAELQSPVPMDDLSGRLDFAGLQQRLNNSPARMAASAAAAPVSYVAWQKSSMRKPFPGPAPRQSDRRAGGSRGQVDTRSRASRPPYRWHCGCRKRRPAWSQPL